MQAYTDPFNRFCKNFIAMNKKTVEVGSAYIKTGVPHTIWIVGRLMDIPEAGMHVQMHQHDHPRRTLTVSLSAILDRNLYQQIELAA